MRQFSEEFHKKYTKINILINNAGVGFPFIRKDADGHDLTFKTNHMGPFLLTSLLMDLIISTKKSRIINVSSKLHTAIQSSINFK